VGCCIWYSEEGPGAPPSPLLAVPNATAHPSTASVPTSYYFTWHYNCIWALTALSARKGHAKIISLLKIFISDKKLKYVV